MIVNISKNSVQCMVGGLLLLLLPLIHGVFGFLFDRLTREQGSVIIFGVPLVFLYAYLEFYFLKHSFATANHFLSKLGISFVFVIFYFVYTLAVVRAVGGVSDALDFPINAMLFTFLILFSFIAMTIFFAVHFARK